MSDFESNILSIYKKKGEIWLQSLPERVSQLAASLGLSALAPYANLSFHYVLSGYQNEVPVVLKLGIDRAGLEKEAKALEAFAGYGAVSLLDQKEDALLLQRAVPGRALKSIEVACKVMDRLHRAPLPKKEVFPHIQEWLAILDKEWALPKAHLEKARALKKELLCHPPSKPVLLHGDLHQDNIISNGDDWLVIDPKGVIGYPINEVLGCIEDVQSDLPYIANYFNFNLDELAKWYYVHLIMAACWQVEDGLDPTRFLDLANLV